MQSQETFENLLDLDSYDSPNQLKHSRSPIDSNLENTPKEIKGIANEDENKDSKVCYFFDEVKKSIKENSSIKTNLYNYQIIKKKPKQKHHQKNLKTDMDLRKWKMKQCRWPQEIALAERRARKAEE